MKLRAEIAEKEAAIYRDSQGSLQHLHEEHGECLKKHLEITASWSSREKQHLSSERQRLERAKDHLHLDKEHVEAEHLELNKEILDQKKEFQKRKDELAKERGSLQVMEKIKIAGGKSVLLADYKNCRGAWRKALSDIW